MLSANRGIWQALIPLWFLLVSVFVQAGCSCGPQRQAQSNKTRPCIPQHAHRAVAPPLQSKTIVPGATPASFAVTDSGDAALSISLEVPPGRAGVEPSLTISHSSAGGDGVLGAGFAVSGASAITRCAKTMAIDSEIRSVQYDADDALCIDGKRLVIVARNGDTMEYRTFPDTQIKVIGHLTGDDSHFEAFLPSGRIVEYGKTAGTRPHARNGAPRAWLATETRDPRGNTMTYGYCFAESDEGFTEAYALDEIRYTGFGDDEGTRTVSFVYGTKNPDDVRTIYSAGMALQSALRLEEVQTSVNDDLVSRYEFNYAQSATTRRTLLQSVQECGADGTCKPETRFQYAKTRRGFEQITTTLQAPMSLRASPILADMNGDGLSDWFVPDMTAVATESNPITSWLLSTNTGQGLTAPNQAFLQEWSFQQNPEPLPDARLIQPELGTVLDYNQDGRLDVFLHDVYGNRNNHIVLISKEDGTFEEFDTGIQRPFPTGPAPMGLRSAAGAIHIADVDGDGVGDLIQCEDHGDTLETAALSTWTSHRWSTNGFDSKATIIETLTGIPCGVNVHTVDLNADSITDLVAPGFVKQGGTPAALSGNYSVHRRRSDGTWEVFDTELKLPQNDGQTIFMDVNGDGLPDVVQSGSSDGFLATYFNTGRGFGEDAQRSLHTDVPIPQGLFLHLSSVLDYDRDGRADLLMPLLDATSPDIPRWVILRATGGRNGFTFEAIDAGIPFEAQLMDAITIADPRGPRVGDVNGDGAPDVAIFLGNELHLFQNKASDPDVLVSYSDGMNDHDPDEPGFVPNVAISYGHLIDESRTTGQPPKESDVYVAHSDSANDCAYPRHCAVGAKRVVREYATNNGQGGQRRYGLRYRDGRYDRRGYGFLGFGERIVTDLDTNAGTATFYDNKTLVNVGQRNVYPFAGQTQQQWRWAPALPNEPKQDRVELAFADSTLEVVLTNDGQTYFTLSTKRHSRRMQGVLWAGISLEQWLAAVEASNGATTIRDFRVEVLDFDVFGNVLEVEASTIGVDLTYHVTRTVKNDSTRWILGQVQAQAECSKAGVDEKCRVYTYTTNEFGEVDKVETSSNENIPDTKLTVAYDKRDRFGNIEHVLAKDAFDHERESTTIFDDEGVFPKREINALGHETVLEYDQRFGVVTKETDPNGLITEWQYDSFGREKYEARPDGSSTTMTLSRTKMDGVWRLSAQTTTTGGADDETVFDALERPIRTLSYGPLSSRQMQRIEYDRLSGNVAKKSVPIAEGTPDEKLQWDVYEYDAIGREIRHVTPWNAITITAYDGLVVDSVDPSSNHTKTVLDKRGRAKIVVDANSGITQYTYGAFDTLSTVTDPGGAKTTWTRDAFGRVTRLEEPDRGVTTYTHNGFGDLLASVDALGRFVGFDPDALGRMRTRTDTHAGKTLTTSWTWDTAPNGIGKLHTIMSPDALKTYSYTKRGQLEGMAQTVEGSSFAVRQTYDSVGRAKSIDYPQPLGEQPFGVMYDFDEHGFIIGVREKNTSDSFWSLKDVDDAGRIRKERFGNEVETTRAYHHDKQMLEGITTTHGATNIQELAYDWDDRLNLKSRKDSMQVQHKAERFRYDELDRVTCAYFGAVEDAFAPCVTSYAYQANGNLWSKSDVGTYLYKDAKHPHAVTNVPGETFVYDAVGNQIARPGLVTLTYTPFDLPKTITKGGQTTTFGYDGDEHRVRKVSPTSETVYLADLFEQVTTVNGALEHRYYVFSPERAIAVVTRGSADSGTRYLHVDHLGSVESVTNETGAVVEKRSYDVFGARRNPQWGLPGSAASSKLRKGFTGHEEDEEFGLVNMKGRMMDPRLGRFTSTDPVIADIWNGQSLNRYAYVLNNPLAFVDPTGFVPGSPAPDAEEARRQKPVIVVDETRIVEPRPQWAPKPDPLDLAPAAEAANVGANAPPVDVNTTGTGAESLPRETAGEEPLPALSVTDGIWDGLGDALHGVWNDLTTPIWETAFEMHDAYKQGDAVDALNVINPLIPIANISLAADDGDTYSVTRQSVALGVTIVGTVIVGKVVAAKTGVGQGGRSTRGPPKAEMVHEVRLPSARFPETAAHVRDAQTAGHPLVLTIERIGADANRHAAQSGHVRPSGMQLDEYPPAMFREGGKGASVRPVSPRDNMGAGACIGNQCRHLPSGSKVRIIVE